MAEFDAAPSTGVQVENDLEKNNIKKNNVEGSSLSAHPMSERVFADQERADFIAEWEAVQTRFAPDPQAAADAARHLVGEVANRLVSRIEEIHEAAAGAPQEEDTDADTPEIADEPETEAQLQEARDTLLRCREAFFRLVAS